MDIYAIFENDRYGAMGKLSELGIHSVYQSGVKASGPTWFEEEGIYIAYTKLAVVLVDGEMLDDRCDGYAVTRAINCHIPVYALIQDGSPDTEAKFRERFGGCEIFHDVNKFLNSILEFQITNRTGSGLTVKADMYFRAMLYDEALVVCDEYLEYAQAEMEKNSYLPTVYVTKDMCAVLELMATVYFVRKEYEKVEKTLLRQIEVLTAEPVIWARNKLLYTENLLLAFYEMYYPNAEMQAALKEKTEGGLCFGFNDEEKVENTAKMKQQVMLFFEKCNRLARRYEEEKQVKTEKPTGNLHRLIAEHIETSILLFNELVKCGVPIGFNECLATGYDRLMEYCRIIGERELAVKCLDAIAPNIKSGYIPEEEISDEAMLNLKCIKAYLGQTQPDSGNFDVFISHRSHDIEIAKTVYTHLKSKGKEAFLDRVALPVMGDSEYRNSILEAIDNSSHFVLVASDVNFFDSKWVKEECNLFCDEKREGRKNGNFIMVFPRQVCGEIFSANKKNLPIQLRSFEIIALEDIEENLMRYII